MLELLSCFRCSGEDGIDSKTVDLTSEATGESIADGVSPILWLDPYDRIPVLYAQDCDRVYPVTPRQQGLRDSLSLPALRRYPAPPGFDSSDPEEKKQELLRVYREFVLDLHKGKVMTQLTSASSYSEIHCQVLEDLQTLKVDQGSGCLVEFPLAQVSKVYRIVRVDDEHPVADAEEESSAEADRLGPLLVGPASAASDAASTAARSALTSEGTDLGSGCCSRAEHIVVVEFRKRKLALVFKELIAAQQFLTCMELMVRTAQEGHRDRGCSASRRNAEAAEAVPMFSKENAGGLRRALASCQAPPGTLS